MFLRKNLSDTPIIIDDMQNLLLFIDNQLTKILADMDKFEKQKSQLLRREATNRLSIPRKVAPAGLAFLAFSLIALSIYLILHLIENSYSEENHFSTHQITNRLIRALLICAQALFMLNGAWLIKNKNKDAIAQYIDTLPNNVISFAILKELNILLQTNPQIGMLFKELLPNYSTATLQEVIAALNQSKDVMSHSVSEFKALHEKSQGKQEVDIRYFSNNSYEKNNILFFIKHWKKQDLNKQGPSLESIQKISGP